MREFVIETNVRADGGTRTHTSLRTLAPEASASTIPPRQRMCSTTDPSSKLLWSLYTIHSHWTIDLPAQKYETHQIL